MATIQKLTGRGVTVAQDHAPQEESKPSAPGPENFTLPGIDIAKGLSVWLDAKDYGEYLHKFAATYADCISRLNAHYGADDDGAARALAHKLRGAAGTMALDEVARCAGELEMREAGQNPAAALHALQQALETAFSSIALFGRLATDPDLAAANHTPT